MRIRAHHLLCMQGFQGYGYNQEFVDNMAKVIKDIKSNPNLGMELIDECDVICLACPHNVRGICQQKEDSSRKAKDMDLRVLRKLGLKSGAEVRAGDILSLTDRKFKNISDIEDICADCDWQKECSWFISRHQGNMKLVNFDACKRI